jgi:hypothetical protein
VTAFVPALSDALLEQVAYLVRSDQD